MYGFVIAVVTALLLLSFSFYNHMKPIEPDNQAYAYLEVFKSMTSNIAEDEVEYIAVNIRNILYKNPHHIKKLIEDYTKEYDVPIIWNNKKSNFGAFKNSYLIIFEDVELTKTELKTDVTSWLAPLAAASYAFTVEKDAEKWTITDLELKWIS